MSILQISRVSGHGPLTSHRILLRNLGKGNTEDLAGTLTLFLWGFVLSAAGSVSVSLPVETWCNSACRIIWILFSCSFHFRALITSPTILRTDLSSYCQSKTFMSILPAYLNDTIVSIKHVFECLFLKYTHTTRFFFFIIIITIATTSFPPYVFSPHFLENTDGSPPASGSNLFVCCLFESLISMQKKEPYQASSRYFGSASLRRMNLVPTVYIKWCLPKGWHSLIMLLPFTKSFPLPFPSQGKSPDFTCKSFLFTNNYYVSYITTDGPHPVSFGWSWNTLLWLEFLTAWRIIFERSVLLSFGTSLPQILS